MKNRSYMLPFMLMALTVFFATDSEARLKDRTLLPSKQTKFQQSKKPKFEKEKTVPQTLSVRPSNFKEIKLKLEEIKDRTRNRVAPFTIKFENTKQAFRDQDYTTANDRDELLNSGNPEHVIFQAKGSDRTHEFPFPITGDTTDNQCNERKTWKISPETFDLTNMPDLFIYVCTGAGKAQKYKVTSAFFEHFNEYALDINGLPIYYEDVALAGWLFNEYNFDEQCMVSTDWSDDAMADIHQVFDANGCSYPCGHGGVNDTEGVTQCRMRASENKTEAEMILENQVKGCTEGNRHLVGGPGQNGSTVSESDVRRMCEDYLNFDDQLEEIDDTYRDAVQECEMNAEMSCTQGQFSQ